MSIVLGSVPDTLVLNLTHGGDFVQSMESVVSDTDDTPVDWVDGETLTIVFSNAVTWPADLAGNVASWAIDKADVETLVATNYLKAKLVYTADTLDVVWAQGVVAVK